MTASRAGAGLKAYLKQTFPGSSVDHGYVFVAFAAPSFRRARESALQSIVDRLCTGDSWLVAVNVNWPLVGETKDHEILTVYYTPERDVQEPHDEHVAVIAGTLDVLPVLRSIRMPGALAVINPAHGLAFDISRGKLYGKTREAVDAFCAQLPDAFHPRDPAFGE